MQSAKKMVGYTHNVGIISYIVIIQPTLSLYSQNKNNDMINLQYFSDFNMSIILLITEIQNSIP